MSEGWSYIWDILVISLFLGLATYIKRSFKFFKRFFIPNAIIAGFIGLLLGPQFLKLVSFDSEHLGMIIYHLMSIGFISLALKDRNTAKSKDIINTGIFIVNGYVLQGIVGFGLSLFMATPFFLIFSLSLACCCPSVMVRVRGRPTPWASNGKLLASQTAQISVFPSLQWAFSGRASEVYR